MRKAVAIFMTLMVAWVAEISVAEAQQAQFKPKYRFRWIQVGGPWVSGYNYTDTARCGHGAPGSRCGAEVWAGSYPNGAETYWRRGGCSKPKIVISCQIERNP